MRQRTGSGVQQPPYEFFGSIHLVLLRLVIYSWICNSYKWKPRHILSLWSQFSMLHHHCFWPTNTKEVEVFMCTHEHLCPHNDDDLRSAIKATGKAPCRWTCGCYRYTAFRSWHMKHTRHMHCLWGKAVHQEYLHLSLADQSVEKGIPSCPQASHLSHLGNNMNVMNANKTKHRKV